MKEIFNINDIETISCNLDEQETSINMFRDSKEVRIYTSDNTMVTKLSKIFNNNKGTWKCFEVDRDKENKVSSYLFITNKKSISFRTGKGKQLSEENREKARERFREMHKKNKQR